MTRTLVVLLFGLLMFVGKAKASNQPPTASLQASPTTINQGQGSTLNWATSNATSATLNGSAVALNGSEVVTPGITTAYVLVAMNSRRSTTVSVTVTVHAAQLVVSNIQPISGAWDSTYMEMVNGSGFVSGATAIFGNNPPRPCYFVSSVQLFCVPSNPNGVLGIVDVTITNPSGRSATLVSGFTFTVGVQITPKLTDQTCVLAGQELQFSAVVTDPHGLTTDQTVDWATDIGSIDQTGLLSVPVDTLPGTAIYPHATSHAAPVGESYSLAYVRANCP